MPRIPGVPGLEPVNQPEMSPQEASRVSNSVSQLGNEANQSVISDFDLELYMKRAQEHIDILTARNELNQIFDDTKNQLHNTQNSRDVDDVIEHAHKTLNDISKRWSASPAATQIQQGSDSLRPQLTGIGTVRKADLMIKENKLQTDAQIDKLIPAYVDALRGGDPNAAAILAHMNSIYDDSGKNKLMGDAEVNDAKEKLRVDIQKQINEAAISSLNPSERKAAIRQAKSGGTGPLDLTNMTQGEKNLLHDSAEEMDKHITAQGEAQNLNTALNIKHSIFDDPKNKSLYQNPDGSPNWEARRKTLETDKFYTDNGIMDENGKPDMVMGDKLMQDEVRLRGYAEKDQADRDEKALTPLYSQIEDGKVSRPQLQEAIKGLSARAKSMAISKWHQNENEARAEFRMEHQMSIQERQLKSQNDAEKSKNEFWNIYGKIQNGEVVEPLDIYGDKELNKQDRSELLSAIKTPNQYIQDARNRISDLPLPDTEKAELFRILINHAKQGNLQGEAITKAVDLLVKRAKESGANAWIEDTFKNMNQVAYRGGKGVVRKDTIGPAPGSPEYEKMQKNETNKEDRKVGDVKHFPNGRIGKWNGSNWVAQ